MWNEIKNWKNWIQASWALKIAHGYLKSWRVLKTAWSTWSSLNKAPKEGLQTHLCSLKAIWILPTQWPLALDLLGRLRAGARVMWLCGCDITQSASLLQYTILHLKHHDPSCREALAVICGLGLQNGCRTSRKGSPLNPPLLQSISTHPCLCMCLGCVCVSCVGWYQIRVLAGLCCWLISSCHVKLWPMQWTKYRII